MWYAWVASLVWADITISEIIKTNNTKDLIRNLTCLEAYDTVKRQTQKVLPEKQDSIKAISSGFMQIYLTLKNKSFWVVRGPQVSKDCTNTGCHNFRMMSSVNWKSSSWRRLLLLLLVSRSLNDVSNYCYSFDLIWRSIT